METLIKIVDGVRRGDGWDFDKEQFIKQVELLDPEQFNNVCKKILQLQEYKDVTTGLWATDQPGGVDCGGELFELK